LPLSLAAQAQMYFGADRFHLIAAQMGREWHFAPQKNNL
jgi:hypothetical protein